VDGEKQLQMIALQDSCKRCVIHRVHALYLEYDDVQLAQLQ